ncbi:hypothetical protein [Mycobacterium sp. E342]|uniref:hypothetical protein n=1 Tax=Mycobacterium sp. E342 TaxID=1834147 RepID=UPI000B10EF30|nr:hypothetical protein [Mycobacterium sp. E342]
MDIAKIAGLVLTTVGLIAGFLYFRAGRQRKKILFDTRSLKLITAELNDEQNKLEIVYGHRRLDQPYAVDVELTNIGHSDIGAKDFDGDGALQISIGAEIISRMQLETSNITKLNFDETEQSINVKPAKFGRNQVHRARILVDGKPEVTIGEQHPLLNTDIITTAGLLARYRPRGRQLFRTFAASGFIAVICSLGTEIWQNGWKATILEGTSFNVWNIWESQSKVPHWVGWLLIVLIAVAAVSGIASLYLYTRIWGLEQRAEFIESD